jgi:hypothetical protein
MMLETLQQRTYRIARELEQANVEVSKTKNILLIQNQLVAVLDDLLVMAKDAFTAELAKKEGE